MKKYTRTQQEIKAIKFTGENYAEIKNGLGYGFDILTNFETDQMGYSLLIYPTDEKEKPLEVYLNDWVVRDNFHLYAPKIFVVSNNRFKEEFVQQEK